MRAGCAPEAETAGDDRRREDHRQPQRQSRERQRAGARRSAEHAASGARAALRPSRRSAENAAALRARTGLSPRVCCALRLAGDARGNLTPGLSTRSAARARVSLQLLPGP